MITLSWFGLGVFTGIAIAEIVTLIILKCDSNKLTNEEFVKALIKEYGYEKANNILTFDYEGRYLNIWRKLYREHITGDNENDN